MMWYAIIYEHGNSYVAADISHRFIYFLHLLTTVLSAHWYWSVGWNLLSSQWACTPTVHELDENYLCNSGASSASVGASLQCCHMKDPHTNSLEVLQTLRAERLITLKEGGQYKIQRLLTWVIQGVFYDGEFWAGYNMIIGEPCHKQLEKRDTQSTMQGSQKDHITKSNASNCW
jgi:hypothetical protein